VTRLNRYFLKSAVTVAGAFVVFAVMQSDQRFWLDPSRKYTKAAVNIC
jgi:hypothetical protein